jgi:(2Fe-2S) ferredoxin
MKDPNRHWLEELDPEDARYVLAQSMQGGEYAAALLLGLGVGDLRRIVRELGTPGIPHVAAS